MINLDGKRACDDIGHQDHLAVGGLYKKERGRDAVRIYPKVRRSRHGAAGGECRYGTVDDVEPTTDADGKLVQLWEGCSENAVTTGLATAFVLGKWGACGELGSRLVHIFKGSGEPPTEPRFFPR